MSHVYFDRYAYRSEIITHAPHPDLGLVVTIPCYKEEDLIVSLTSLHACLPTRQAVEIIVVINHPINANPDIKALNLATFQTAQAFAAIHSTDRKIYHIILEELPQKHAGVGLARKIAMDEAARRFNTVGRPDGIITCFDADSTCDTNYLAALEHYFDEHDKATGVSIYFEHPLSGEMHHANYQAIIDYELFLRYYVHACRWAGFPWAHQTIGSSMAVRNVVYQQQGGMNRRKAGEDFYFLQKIIPLGNFGELNSTTVRPSPRQSDRVPFGTGKAVHDWLKEGEWRTYSLNIFKDLQKLYTKLNSVDDFNQLSITYLQDIPQPVSSFLISIDFEKHLTRIIRHSPSLQTFFQHFHRWFDGFKVLKYVHFARDHYYPNVPVKQAANELLQAMEYPAQDTAHDQLLLFRSMDRKHAP